MTTTTIRDLEALIEQFRRSDWREMHLRVGDIELLLSTDGQARLPERAAAAAPSAPAIAAPQAVAPAAAAPVAPVPAPVAAPSGAPAALPAGWVQVRAPSLGTFYGAPKPGAPKFVEVGARVEPDTDVCLVEVMKLFTTVRAGCTGTVRQVLVNDGALVEFDQPLFVIEPDA